MNKELNELLPSNLISEIDIDIDNSGKAEDTEEDDEGIVDDIGYRPNSNQKSSPKNKKTRFLSDSNIILPQKNLSTNNQMPMFNNINFNLINQQMQMYQQQQQQQQQYYNQNNQMFIRHTNTFAHQPMYQMKFPSYPTPIIERKSTYSYQPNNLNLNQEWGEYQYYNQNHNNNHNQPHQMQAKVSSPSRRHLPSANNLLQYNPLKPLKGNNSQKGSVDLSKGQSYISNHLIVDQFEIDEFSLYLSSLKCEVYEYLCSQKGSRDIQKNLNKSPLQCKTLLINTLKENISKVMVDIYGNYFCQQMIQNSTKEQIMLILGFITKDFVRIAKDYSGTHVLQAILELTHSAEEQNVILASIKGFEIEMAYDNNATHVLQKIIVTINEESRTETNEVIFSNLKDLTLHSNGICLVKKFIGNNHLKENKNRIIQIISSNCLEIAQNPFGNYVIQYLFEEWNINDYPTIIDILINNITSLSMQKFSSNVSEKIIDYLPSEKRKEFLKELFVPNKLMTILKNKYGRFVLKKVSKSLTNEEKVTLKPVIEKCSAVTSAKERNNNNNH